VEAALLQGAEAWGFRTHLWTLDRVAQVIWKTCHVHYSLPQTWRILGHLGWSRQRPARRAKERNDRAITRWKKREWPRIKKKPSG
jgi:transposase